MKFSSRSTILKPYFEELFEKGMREDSRKLLDYRDIQIEINPQVQANGSARIRLGETEVIVGVNLNVGTPFPDTPDEGILIVNAELSPLSSSRFEFGPPQPESIELARVVDRGIRESHSIDVKKLCIKSGEKVWTVMVDIYPVNDAGNLLDAAALGAIVALKNTVFPKYDKETNRVLSKELTKTKLPMTDTPILCTFAKIGTHLFADPSAREEEAYDTRISISTTEDGTICAMQKGNDGIFSEEEVLSLIDTAIEKGKMLRKLVK